MKILFWFLAFLPLSLSAQYTIEAKYSTPYSQVYVMQIAQLSVGQKWFIYDRAASTITLYNMNHSIYRTINIPSQSAAYYEVYYLTDCLFDTDTTDIEYMIVQNTGPVTSVSIYNESGSTLAFLDSAMIYHARYADPMPGLSSGIMPTATGVKMSVFKPFLDSTYIYSLPGRLLCAPCGGGPSGVYYSVEETAAVSTNRLPYPNPANESVTIPYVLPNGASRGQVLIYDLNGKEVASYEVDNRFLELLIMSGTLPAGTYYYSVVANGQATKGNKLLIVH